MISDVLAEALDTIEEWYLPTLDKRYGDVAPDVRAVTFAMECLRCYLDTPGDDGLVARRRAAIHALTLAIDSARPAVTEALTCERKEVTDVQR